MYVAWFKLSIKLKPSFNENCCYVEVYNTKSSIMYNVLQAYRKCECCNLSRIP